MDFENYRKLVDWEAIDKFRKRALNPDNPQVRGTAENPDVYFQHTEAANKFYDAMPDIVADYMDKISEITGRSYKPFNYYGAPDAEYVVVSMGSLSDVAKQTVEYLQSPVSYTHLDVDKRQIWNWLSMMKRPEKNFIKNIILIKENHSTAGYVW